MRAKYEDAKLASEQFDTYGGWWHDGTRATYYYNNADPLERDFYTGVMAEPMKEPMGMNLVHETYPFPWITLPTDRELGDTSLNYCLYDWVRAYVQVDDDASSPYGNAPKLDLYQESVSFINNSMVMDAAQVLSIPFSFQANEDRFVVFTITDDNKKVLVDTTFQAYEGYAHYVLDCQLEKVPAGGSYTLMVKLKASADASVIIDAARASLLLNGSAAIAGVHTSPLKVSPNPVTELLYVEGAEALANYQIYNLHGKLVMNGSLGPHPIDVEGLVSGLYILNMGEDTVKFQKI